MSEPHYISDDDSSKDTDGAAATAPVASAAGVDQKKNRVAPSSKPSAVKAKATTTKVDRSNRRLFAFKRPADDDRSSRRLFAYKRAADDNGSTRRLFAFKQSISNEARTRTSTSRTQQVKTGRNNSAKRQRRRLLAESDPYRRPSNRFQAVRLKIMEGKN